MAIGRDRILKALEAASEHVDWVLAEELEALCERIHIGEPLEPNTRVRPARPYRKRGSLTSRIRRLGTAHREDGRDETGGTR